MTVYDVIDLLGGIALFLYGMSIMGSGLERIAGGKMQKILQKLTASTLRGLLLGTLITMVIQSSAGTIVIVIGLVNSGIMALPQAVGVILGANIGTTVTGQLIRLADIDGGSWFLTLLKPSTFSPIVAFIGAILFVFLKSPGKRNVGQIMLGFGILFTGMSLMDGAVAPLKESEFFVRAFTSMENPFLGLLVGLLATVAIQSSSASVGILQALTSTGLVTWGSSLPIILGTHVGTAFTPLIAASGSNKNAKRAAMIHLWFNVIGSFFFLVLFSVLHMFVKMPFWDMIMNKGSVANLHTTTSLAAALLMLPFSNVLVRLSMLCVPDKPGEAEESMPTLDDRLLSNPLVALQQAKSAMYQMAARANTNYHLAVPMLESYNEESVAEITAREDLIDKMEVSIGNYLLKINDRSSLAEHETHVVNELISFTTEYERIGDYSINVVELAQQLQERGLQFSEQATREMALLTQAVGDIIDLANQAFTEEDSVAAAKIEPLEEVVDVMCGSLRSRHIRRLTNGECQIEAGIIFLDVLTNLERISDHCSNIGARLVGAEQGYTDMDAHALKEKLHTGAVEQFNRRKEEYMETYYEPLLRATQADDPPAAPQPLPAVQT